MEAVVMTDRNKRIKSSGEGCKIADFELGTKYWTPESAGYQTFEFILQEEKPHWGKTNKQINKQ